MYDFHIKISNIISIPYKIFDSKYEKVIILLIAVIND